MKAIFSASALSALLLASCGVEQVAPINAEQGVVLDQGAPKGNSACLNAYMDSVVTIKNCAALKLYAPDSVPCIVAYLTSGDTATYRQAVDAFEAQCNDLPCESLCMHLYIIQDNAQRWQGFRHEPHCAGIREEEPCLA